jgi:hypothetical protein
VKVGDIVRVLPDRLGTPAAPGWAAYQIGVVVKMAKRLHIPAAKVMVLNMVAEFDLDELEVISETR